MNMPTNHLPAAGSKGPAPAFEYEACPSDLCPYGKGHFGECVEITGSRPRRCAGCDEVVGDRHLMTCHMGEPGDRVEGFDCREDA